jgi:hypothetical protein
MVTAFKHPNNLVMIKSRTESLLLGEEDVVLLRALDTLSKEASARHEVEDLLLQVSQDIKRRLGSKKLQTENLKK